MNLIRPEARDAFWRWREVVFGAVVTALGANWAFTAYGILNWLGWVVLIIGLGLLITGLQRARVRPRSGGVGVVDLDEARLSYLLPQGGIVVPLSQIVRIDIDTFAGGSMVWVFTDEDGHKARIPAGAAKAEKLLDALSHFPGASYNRVIEASSAKGDNSFVIWQKNTARLH
ncbi:hypothetical protein RXV86_13930 [Alisedimentitalea sp. MJ-SS2]|uniref:hypothetical protein n=1 Tax=Aliisedimentitalea sp. MJ-SS2 TaxID=3049795 RepID=UPI00291184D8|nr:hypothetical protein [Alisedimentitalea sp. MJ-SS2]MDU8928485.1 hypothetical protein [Alisedimentitalea sp. MJ-SS2]